MDTDSSVATSFLFAKGLEAPDGFFQGYCFSGADYIFGAQGAETYRASTGKRIGYGLDGCYVTTENLEGAVRFGNDYAGYKVLYYYHDGDIWVVSNSYALIVDHLRGISVDTVPNYAHLSGIIGLGSAHHQLSSFETPTRGVRVLPRGCNLIISDDKAIVERWPEGFTRSYAEGLEAHLETWLRRFETLMLDTSSGFTIDVTGGVDSRTNFALAAKAGERLGRRGEQPRLNCGSSPSNVRDLEVATKLTAEFSLELNDARRFAGHALTAAESFSTFRNLNAGVYYPIYLPTEGPFPGKISIGGGGGEIHRRFYENHKKSSSVSDFLKTYSNSLTHPWMGLEYSRDVNSAMKTASWGNSNRLRAHYREFRHRFHVGRSPRYGVTFTPLDSVSADVAQSQAGADRLDEGQFNYDVMGSLYSSLLDMPFDQEGKAPAASVRSRLVRVPVASEARPGRVWAPDIEPRKVRRSATQRWSVVSSAVESSADNPMVREFWGESVVAAARDLLVKLVAGESVGNAVNLKPISAVVAADLAFGGTGGLPAVAGV